MKPIVACIFVVSFLMIFTSLVRFDVFVMPLGGSKMLVVDVSIGPYQWLGRSPSHQEVLTPVQLLLRLQNHHHHTQAATTTRPQTSLAMDQEEKKQVQSGSSASERKSTRETPDRKGITFSLFSLEDLPLYFVCKLIDVVSVCILLAIYLLCSKVSQLVRSSPKALEKPKEPPKPKPPPKPKEPEKPKPPEKPKEPKKPFPPPVPVCAIAPPPPPPPLPYPYPYPYQSYIPPENLEQYFGHKRNDVAARLGVSVSTFKRMCRRHGIWRWPRIRGGARNFVSKPPDQHGERNTSTACEMPSHNVHTGMEGELFGQNEVENVFQRDSMGGPIALDEESGLIMVSRPPGQYGERNTSTAREMSSRNVETEMEGVPVGQNQEEFQRDFTEGTIPLNTDGLTFPECSVAVAPSQPMATILDTIPHLNGGSSVCAFQVKNQSPQFTANPYSNGLVDPHPQIALTQILSENMERLEDCRNLLAPRKEPLPEGHVFGSFNWTVRSCSDLALSQPMPTIPHTTGCSEYWRNSLALLEKHLLEENDYGSINLTALSCLDPGPSQPMDTIPHTMPTIPQMMPLLTEKQDMRSVRLKAAYGNTTIKFPLPSGFSELEEEVSKRLEFERGSFKLEYKDEEGDSVLIACDEDVRDYLRLLTSLGNQVVKLFVHDKVPNTTNFCDNCRSLTCKRP